MSGKKQAAKAETKVAAPVVKAKTAQEKIKRDETGAKIMKVARGTARAKRREGLVKNWMNIPGAKKMLAPAPVVPTLIATL